MMAALRRVEANKGAPGVDGMPVEQLRAYLKAHWPRIKEDLDFPPWSGGVRSERHAAVRMVIRSMLARASAGVR
jgi:hypothetical protein